MARYYTGAFADQEAIAAAVNTVLTGEGWSQDELDNVNNEAGWNDGTHYVQMDWDAAADIRLYQSTAWDGAGTAPGSHTGDSGSNHIVNAIGDPSGTYHAYTNNSVGPDYFHFVIHHSAGFYRHFGFGYIDAAAGFAGGFYCYGHLWDQANGAIDVPNAGTHSVLIDGGYSANVSPATIKITGTQWPNAPTNCRYATSHTNATIGNDGEGDGRYRAQGGVRRGAFTQQLFLTDPTTGDAFFSGAPVDVWAKDDTHSDPEHWMLMGYMPNIFVGSMENLSDEHEETFGSDTWEFFPIVNSSWSGADPNTEQSGNGCIAYRKV